AQHEELFRNEVWKQLAEFSGYTEEGVKNVFDLQRVDMLTDTSNKGTEENPVYTYTLQANNWTDGIFYMWISDFYFWLHTKNRNLLQSFKYYPDFGIVNYAGCYGYDVSGDPEMKDKIDAWLAEHAPGVVTRMSDDDGLLNLGWDETDGDIAYEPYNPYHDMYGIWQDLGYMPAKSAVTLLYRHGEEFAVDFLQWQKYYDDISEEIIQYTMEKYQLDRIRSQNYHLWLGLPEDTVNELCRRSGSTYKTEYFYSPFEELVTEHDLAEGLNIGFAASIDLYNSIPQQVSENKTCFCYAEVQSQLVRSGLNGGQSLMNRLHEDAHILAYLDRYLGLPFQVYCEDPAEKAPVFSKSFDDLMKMSSEEISKLTGRDFAASLASVQNQTGKENVLTLELLLEKETVDRFWMYVVVENPEESGGAFDITVLSTAEIARFLSLPEEMIQYPKETTFYLPKEAKLGDTDLRGITVGIDTTVYGEENSGKAYLLALMYLDAADGIYDRMFPPRGGSTVPFIPGDLNLDGAMDVADAVLLARYCVSDPEAMISDAGMKRADVNGDGDVTAEDVTVILRKIAKMD
ncbi:MAG: dockerin type I repeat-containing protein, partial [Oscillospiraceae bacterium]|nr:dockerin type I repeat-containing protein [Oscillospiraceae bacterium]